MSQANSISAVVGQSVRMWREEAGLTQDQVAKVAVDLGFDWARGTVASIEGGHREVSLSEFLALPFFSQLVGAADSWNRLADFLPPELETGETTDISTGEGAVLDLRADAEVELSPACWIQTEHLRALLAGHPAGGRKVPKDAMVTWRTIGEALLATSRSIVSRFKQSAEPVAPRPQEAEQKAAKRLGVTADDIMAGALYLWGRTLSAERDARAEKQATDDASPRRLQAIRGHVTRDLLNELRPVLETKGDTQ